MKVLVAPLDWGLGHATRCIPVVREFLRQGAQVELAVVKANARLLREAFPELRQRLAPSYNVVYPKHGYNMGLWLVKNGVHLNAVSRFEHRFVEEMVARHHYDVILSDNRFGFYSRAAKSIYMTHQRRIAFPQALSAMEPVGQLWHASVMKRFDEVWVPDYEEAPGLAGAMSHVKICPRTLKYVGALSRFSWTVGVGAESAAGTVAASAAPLGAASGVAESIAPAYKFVAVVSGVEPARSRFEEKLKQAFARIPGRHAIIQGRPAAGVKTWTEGNVQFFTHLPDAEFARVVQGAEWLVSRGGYSTVMDMAYLGGKCVFVPTPGQYEQIVLGDELSRAGYANCISERNFSAESLLDLVTRRPEVKIPQPPQESPLVAAVKSVLEV